MSEMTPEKRKEAVLMVLKSVETKLEGKTIENLLIDLDFKVEPTWEQGISEPVKIESRGLRCVIDFTYQEVK